MSQEIKDERDKLQAEAQNYRNAIQETVTSSVDVVRNSSTKLMIGVGVAVGSYLVLQLLRPKKKTQTVTTSTTQEGDKVIVQKKRNSLLAALEKQVISVFSSVLKKELVSYLARLQQKMQQRAKEREAEEHKEDK